VSVEKLGKIDSEGLDRTQGLLVQGFPPGIRERFDSIDRLDAAWVGRDELAAVPWTLRVILQAGDQDRHKTYRRRRLAK
jgi:hypothetical protein